MKNETDGVFSCALTVVKSELFWMLFVSPCYVCFVPKKEQNFILIVHDGGYKSESMP